MLISLALAAAAPTAQPETRSRTDRLCGNPHSVYRDGKCFDYLEGWDEASRKEWCVGRVTECTDYPSALETKCRVTALPNGGIRIEATNGTCTWENQRRSTIPTSPDPVSPPSTQP